MENPRACQPESRGQGESRPGLEFPTIAVQAARNEPRDPLASPLERDLGQIAHATEMRRAVSGRLASSCNSTSTRRAPLRRPNRPMARSIPPTPRSSSSSLVYDGRRSIIGHAWSYSKRTKSATNVTDSPRICSMESRGGALLCRKRSALQRGSVQVKLYPCWESPALLWRRRPADR